MKQNRFENTCSFDGPKIFKNRQTREAARSIYEQNEQENEQRQTFAFCGFPVTQICGNSQFMVGKNTFSFSPCCKTFGK